MNTRQGCKAKHVHTNKKNNKTRGIHRSSAYIIDDTREEQPMVTADQVATPHVGGIGRVRAAFGDVDKRGCAILATMRPPPPIGHMNAHMHTCTHRHTHTHAYACAYTHTNTVTYIHTRTCTCARTCTHAHIHTSTDKTHETGGVNIAVG